MQMRRVFEDTGRPVVALMEVSAEETSRYGIVGGTMLGGRRFHITDMVEKPKINPPSRYAIIGRYILPPETFAILGKTERGAGARSSSPTPCASWCAPATSTATSSRERATTPARSSAI